MFIKLAIFFVLNLLLVPSFNFAMLAPDFKTQVDVLRGQLDQVCASPECVSSANLVCTEQVLSQLMGVSYFDLLSLSGSDKSGFVTDFANRLCAASTGMASASSGWFGAIAGARASAQALGAQGYQPLVLDNLANLEHFLQAILGKTYRELIGEMFERKRDQVIDTLRDLLEPKPVISGGFGTSVGLVPGAGAGVGAGVGAGAGLIAGMDVAEMSLNDLGNSGPLNRVGLYDNPIIGKYFDDAGYAMATMNLALKNNKISADLLRFVHRDIQPFMVGCVVDFYTEVITWNQAMATLLDGTPVPFEDKNREFNITFHSTMMSWFADKYPAYDFKSQSISESLLIGVFDYNGISNVIAVGNNILESQPVNPHDGHFSPDNTRIQVAPDRNIVTFWSAAKSVEKNRVVVTYHILINGDVYPEQKDLIADACFFRNNLRDFVNAMGRVETFSANFAALDHAAWVQAIDFLRRMYGAYI